MRVSLSRLEVFALVIAFVILAAISAGQHRRLEAVQLVQKQALYAERLRTAQVILEDEMLRAAYLTSTDTRTRERARAYLERSP